MVNAFLDEDRLERREAKNDSRRTPTRDHGDSNLG